ncbi:predicted protein [Chaetoceros tenuissimus]|uniref:Uncharacterized protein n=1 Tax=Chaetoceros tenuissimus TaxID=426638 RepID=A0AAD3H0W6_9STRA|nr:predicted protein [Chaetoceros tenuissimus]
MKAAFLFSIFFNDVVTIANADSSLGESRISFARKLFNNAEMLHYMNEEHPLTKSIAMMASNAEDTLSLQCGLDTFNIYEKLGGIYYLDDQYHKDADGYASYCSDFSKCDFSGYNLTECTSAGGIVSYITLEFCAGGEYHEHVELVNVPHCIAPSCGKSVTMKEIVVGFAVPVYKLIQSANGLNTTIRSDDDMTETNILSDLGFVSCTDSMKDNISSKALRKSAKPASYNMPQSGVSTFTISAVSISLASLTIGALLWSS